jgi:hypothetical protein
MNKEEIQNIINADPNIAAKIAERKARGNKVRDAITILNDFINGTINGVVVVGCAPSGGAKYSAIVNRGKDAVVLLGMLEIVEKKLLEQVNIDPEV